MWQGFVCVTFVIDVFARRIVEWRFTRTSEGDAMMRKYGSRVSSCWGRAGPLLDLQRARAHAQQVIHRNWTTPSRGPNRTARTPRARYSVSVVHRGESWHDICGSGRSTGLMRPAKRQHDRRGTQTAPAPSLPRHEKDDLILQTVSSNSPGCFSCS